MRHYDIGAIRHPGWREAEANPDAYRYDSERGEWVRKGVSLIKNTPAPRSGYTPCACRDCMDIAMSSDMTKPELCSECKDAGCEAYPAALAVVDYAITPATCFDCQRDDAYSDNIGDAGTGHGAYEYRSGW